MFKSFLKKHGMSILKLLFFIAMAIFIVWSIKQEVESIDFVHTIMILRRLPIVNTMLILLLGILGVSSITYYDFLITKYFNLGLRPSTIFNVSFIASAINNISGLGGLTGASIRTAFFKKGDNKADYIDYNLFLIPATSIGLSVFSILSLILYKYTEPIINKYNYLFFILLGFIIYFFVYFFIDIIFYRFKKTDIELFDGKRFVLKIKLIFASIVHCIILFALFFIIIRQFNANISPLVCLVVFTLASITGIVSMLPGGLGSFDFIILVGLQYYGIATESILAALILYRVFYYIIPLVLSIIFTLIIQSQRNESNIKIFDVEKLKGFISRTSGLTNFLLSILVFVSGLVLLFSALVPGIIERIKFATKLLSFPILQWSRQLSILIGVFLISISREIKMKVKRGYRVTWWLLLSGALFTFIKGFDYEEAIFLTIVLILLRLSKDSFYRRSLPFDWFWTLISSLVILIGVTIYMKLSHVILLDFLRLHNFKTIFSKGFSSFKIRGIFTYGSFIIYIIAMELTKERIKDDKRYEEIDVDRVDKFLRENTGSYLSHLIYLKDKHLYWAQSQKVLIAFEARHNVIIVLGDPIGNEKYFDEALDEFHNFIDEYGYKLVFYEVGEKFLPLYHEHGYYFFKLGEMALVDLEDFDIKSPKSRDFRNVLSRFKRDGYYFQMIDGKDLDDDLYDELFSISEEWLKGRNEMGFSLGFMDRFYLEQSPIGLIRNEGTKKVIAFASLMPKFDNETYSLDLMRFKEDIPKNTMEFLILNLILYLQEQNFKIFNLGMAPLSNVGVAQNAHFKERMAHLVYKYGKEVYSFGGLRSYKEKFNPTWESRYLAYDDFALFTSSLLETTMLIHTKR